MANIFHKMKVEINRAENIQIRISKMKMATINCTKLSKCVTDYKTMPAMACHKW